VFIQNLKKIKTMKNKKPDYEGFCLHLEEWEKIGIPHSLSDMIELAKKYNTPIPTLKEFEKL
jgi:hypothetical protein